MAERNIAAKRYAEGVFAVANEQAMFDEWARDLQTIAAKFGDPQLLRFLENSRIPDNGKFALLDRALDEVSREALNYARLLVQRRRVALAPAITDYFREMVEEHRGIAHAEVTTAVPVSDAEKRLIETRLSTLTHKTVSAAMRVDPAIIGGVVAQVGDRLIDGSTRTRLNALRHRLETAR